MIKCARIFLASLFLLISAYAASAANLHLSKGPVHYAREMEFYYQHPRPEMIKDLLRNFSRASALKKAENRLMLGAFLAELLKSGQIKVKALLELSPELDQYARQALAWAIWLSGQADDSALGALLGAPGSPLRKQITQSPPALLQWDPGQEKSVLQMYWAAFMASGKPEFLDKLIRLAVACSEDNPGPMPRHEMCVAAGASLYDFGQKHGRVLERLQAYPQDGPGQNVINLLKKALGKNSASE